MLGRVEKALQLTESETIWKKISTSRLKELLDRPDVVVREVNVDTNSYGEFLFVSISLPYEDTELLVTFYGLGYHEYRESLVMSWQWYDSSRGTLLDTRVSKFSTLTQIDERQMQLTKERQVIRNERSFRSEVYAMLADFGDDDGAISELEDLDYFYPSWDDE